MMQQPGLPAQSTASVQPGAICNEVATLTAALQEMEDLYQNAPCGFHSLDRNQLILKINDTELKWLGYQREEVVGKLTINDLVAPESHAALAHCLAGLLAGQAMHDQKLRMRRKNGEFFSAIANLGALQDAGGNLVMTCATLMDISERERIEAELRASEECFRGAFQSAAIGMVLAGLDGHWTKVNHSLCKSLGYTEQQLLSKGFLDVTHPDDARISNAKVSQLLSGELSYYHLEKRYIHSDGHIVWTFVSGTLVRDAQGTPLHFVGMIEDITERKQAEAALQLAQVRLQELVAYQERIKENERTRIAREIHDELGGLLTAIKANLSVAIHQDERAGSIPNQRLLDASALLDAAVDAVCRVITDLRPSVLDQLGVWAALEWVAGQTEARTGLSCRVTIAASAAQSVIDSERSTALFRIVQETLTNVVRHADASQVEIRVLLEEGAIRMEVEDNGKGIDAGQLPNRKSWGIAGMVERARYFGGDIRITDTSHGTLVVLRLPLENLNG
jgi:PAS domain S-box-containing protein